MRIALVTAGFLPSQGGGEYVVHHLANQWSELGHEVRVLNVVSRKIWHPEARYSVARFWIPRGADRFGYHCQPWLGIATWGLSHVLNAFRPDVVSGHFAVPIAFYLAGGRFPVPWTLTGHGSDLVTGVAGSSVDKYGCQKELEMALGKASAVIAISRSALDTLRSYNLPAGVVRLIPNGVKVERFSRLAPVDIRARLRMPPGSDFMLTVARNAQVKNLSLGLRALARLKNGAGTLYYVMVGKGTRELEPEAHRLGVSNRVVFVEELVGQELVAAYQQAAVYVSTSRREFCPLVILEAMATGLPQVATRVPGNRDLVTENVTGFLVDDDEPAAMSEAIQKLMSSQELRSQLSRNCSRHAELCDWRRVAEQYLDLFESCLHRTSVPRASPEADKDAVPGVRERLVWSGPRDI